MVYTFVRRSPLHGLGRAAGALSDVLEKRAERTYQRQQKEEERYYQEQAEATERRRKEALTEEQRAYEESLEETKLQRQASTFSSIQEKRAAFQGDLSPLDEFRILQDVVAETGDVESVKAYTGIMSSAIGKQGLTDAFEGKTEAELTQIFQDLGMRPEEAKTKAALYQSLTTGGKTAFANQIMDQLARSERGFQFAPQAVSTEPTSDMSDEEIDQHNIQRSPDQDFIFPRVDPFVGMTPKEKFTAKQTLGKENAPFYQEAITATKAVKKAERAIRQLTNINDTQKLPSGIKKWNVKQTGKGVGELRFTGAANKETQLFVKTVNEFVKGAKDSFGARVTNFEIDRFMQQLPSLANTEEGRRLILKQMSIINEIDKLDNDSIKSVYRHYGRGSIDNIQVDDIAEQMKSPQVKILDEQLDRVLLEQDYWEAKKDAPKGMVAIEEQGQIGYLPALEIPEYKRRGGNVL